MSSSISITTALCLAASDVETLIQGRMIAAISRTFINAIPYFAICPADGFDNAQAVKIQAWARLEFCKIYRELDEIEKLSRLTVWDKQTLSDTLQERHKIFVACLRVYQLDQTVKISADRVNLDKIGSFIRLPISLAGTTAKPTLNDILFRQRKQQLIHLESPQYPELEELHGAIAQFSLSNSTAKILEQDIEVFLGWSNNLGKSCPDQDSGWIQTIAKTGDSSDGDEFEKLVRKSLIALGFSNSNKNPKASLDPEATGGAGGIDVYCEAPFPLVGECKASKNETVPNGVAAQLINLGNTHLGKQRFDESVKVIFASGKLTAPSEKAAIENQMNVIRPETLQRLVELKKKYPGSINLIELKPCLESTPFGEHADHKLKSFIDQVEKNIHVRSHLITAIKKLGSIEPDRTQFEVAEIRTQYNADFFKDDGKSLDKQTVYELLIELSSPLAGYLGRVKVSGLSSDHFYFLRDLPID